MKNKNIYQAQPEIYKICFIGSCATGKSSIINRIVNNSFSAVYEPTLELSSYATDFKLKKNNFSEEEEEEVYINDKVTLILDDLFGLNNTIIQTNPTSIKSRKILEKRARMINDFRSVIYSHKEIMSSMQDYKDVFGEISNTSLDFSKIIPRTGLVFVVDITDEDSLNETLTILKQINEVEKMSEKTYKTEKAIFFNKYDKISDNKKIINLKGKLDSYAITINTYEVSALSNWNIQEALSNFICKIQHRFFVKEERYKYSEEIKAKVIEDQSGGCLGTVGCGGGFFSCGRATSD